MNEQALSTSSSSYSLASSYQLSQLCCSSSFTLKKRGLEFVNPNRKNKNNKKNKIHLWIVKSVLNNSSSSSKLSSINDNGATKPARILLERLFTQTQKLEEQICRYPASPHFTELGANLGTLESDLHQALSALKKKEEDLLDAERKISLEYRVINRAKRDLKRREKELVAASLKQGKLEEELRLANVELASQDTEIAHLRTRLKDRDQEMLSAQSALLVREDELVKMKNELLAKTEEAAIAAAQLSSKARLLDEADQTVKRQEIELQQLHSVIQRQEEELLDSKSTQKSEAEKLRVTAAKLEKQTMDWLVAQEELKKLAEETFKHVEEANETMEEFKRVGRLLSDVRSELVSSQKAFVSSKQRVGYQEHLLKKQITELEERRRSITSYMVSLRHAQVEVENERLKLRVAEAQKKELEQDLYIEKELVAELQKDLDKERSSLKLAIHESSALKEKLDLKSAEFEETQSLLHSKEAELVEARLEIQQLQTEQDSLRLILEAKELEISDANKMLEEVYKEISELKGILFGRENELIQATAMLKEKDEHVQTMQHELNTAKLNFSEAETAVERIVDLTKDLVLSIDDERSLALSPLNHIGDAVLTPLLDDPIGSSKWQKKQLQLELEITRESLRAKETEILAAQMALTTKSEELKTVLAKLDSKETEITELKGQLRDKDDLEQLYSLAQQRIGERTIGELAIEELQLEAAQLEVGAATSALQKITEMSRELLDSARLTTEDDSHRDLSGSHGLESRVNSINGKEYSEEIRSEVSRLVVLTEQLVREAGIADETSQQRGIWNLEIDQVVEI